MDAPKLLQGACEPLGLPLAAAKELLRLLEVKASAGPEAGERLGQSGQLDRLLHWVLLNTRVRRSVEAALGSAIEHSTEGQETEHEKAEARLASLNAMSRQGWSPNLDLWQEPGTALESILEVGVREDSSGERFKLFYTAQLGHAAIQRLQLSDGPKHSFAEADLQAFYTCLGQAWQKQLCVERAETESVGSQPANLIPVFVKDLKGRTTEYFILASATVEELKLMIEDREDILVCRQRLIFAGRQLEDGSTLTECGIPKEATVHLVSRLRGC